jgi:hypothetical protein
MSKIKEDKGNVPEVMPEERDGYRDGEKVYTHPAFGQCMVGRVSAGPAGYSLYGSDFRHNHFVSLKISRSELHRDLNRDWPHERERLIEVWFSEAQWASLLSSIGVGEGVKCTIYHTEDEFMPRIPHRDVPGLHAEELVQKTKDMAARVRAAMKAVETTLAKGVSGVKRDAVMEELRMLEQELRSNIPFMVKSFEEHVENVVEQGKVEVNAYAESVIRTAGLTALGATAPVRLLGSGKE